MGLEETRRLYGDEVARPLDEDARGILTPAAIRGPVALERFDPSPHVGRFVDRYWAVTWDLRAHPPLHQEVLPHPVVNLVIDAEGLQLVGVATRRGTQVLEGEGRVVAAMFRPGGFSPLVEGPAAALVDRRLDAVEVLGPAAAGAAHEVRRTADVGEAAARFDDALAALLAAAVPRGGRHECEDATAIAELAAGDRSITRVDQLARAAGVRVRRVQRLFADHVGVGPKGLIRRYRLYEAAERVAWGEPAEWAALAAELGYSDQAHLTRDVTAAYGRSPERYARDCAAALAAAAEPS